MSDAVVTAPADESFSSRTQRRTMPGSVAAIVVTYNRKELLAGCLDAILRQTRPVDRLIVVDNCSNDGTPEFLSDHGFLKKPVFDYVRLEENLGSAGGFHAGMERAYTQGFQWLWVMDDDGLPFADTLSRLLDCPDSIWFRGCVILNRDDPDRELLTFGIETPIGTVHRVSELDRLKGLNGLVPGFLNPYNGMLVSREAVERIGVPKKELFIWGDEVEYFLRAKKSGIQIATVLGARFLHPSDRMLWHRVKLGPASFGLPYSKDPFRLYLIVRNYTYMALRYHGPLSKKFLKLLCYPFFFPGRTGLIFRAWGEGATGRLKSGRVVAGLFGRAVTSRTT